MNGFHLTIPLFKKYTVENINEYATNIDAEYLSKLIGVANKFGLEGKRITSFEIKFTEDRQGVDVHLIYE